MEEPDVVTENLPNRSIIEKGVADCSNYLIQ